MQEPKPKTGVYLGLSDVEAENLRAFLDTISHSEGTDLFGQNDGYDVIVGGGLMDGYADHPKKSIYIKSIRSYSTAAGRYQILHRYWEHYKAQLGLPDFGPTSQDKYAVQMFKEQRAYDDVLSGRFDTAIKKCSNIWASFPNAGYGQHENSMRKLRDYYKSRGGNIA